MVTKTTKNIQDLKCLSSNCLSHENLSKNQFPNEHFQIIDVWESGQSEAQKSHWQSKVIDAMQINV